VRKVFLPIVACSLTLLSGCASYNASPLNSLSSQVIYSSAAEAKSSDVTVIAKTFNKVDCKRYLDRDVIEKGYQPIQLYIQNDSDKRYSFSLSRISLPCIRPEEIAEKVHTSTVGRATGYGVASLFLWPLAIPAVVDGVKSSQANEALDNDFSSKAAMDQTIQPHSYLNKLIFVSVNEYQAAFRLTVIDQETGESKSFNVNAN
jgi:hypothetical protein